MFDRYDVFSVDGFIDSEKDIDGEWVKYEDVKQLLERSDNKDYVEVGVKTASTWSKGESKK